MANENGFRKVWDGNSETDCLEVCGELQRARIDYTTSQRPVSRSSRMGVVWRFEVYVSKTDFQSAKQVLGIGKEKECKEPAFELKEDAAPIDGSSLENRFRVEAYLKHWNLEDAIVDVGSQDASDESSIVELSFIENLIHYRLECSENGMRRYFVRPQDEARAREIFRQIKTGDPPS